MSIPVVGYGVRHVEPSGSTATVLGLNSSLSWSGKINTIWLFLWQDFVADHECRNPGRQVDVTNKFYIWGC